MIGLRGRKHWKPSIQETKDSIFLRVKDFSQLDPTLSKLINSWHDKGLPSTQIIIIHGEDIPTAFTLWHESVSYKLPNFLKPLDICIKLFKAYDIEFPAQSSGVWTLLAACLYDFDIDQPNIEAYRTAIKSKNQLQ